MIAPFTRRAALSGLAALFAPSAALAAEALPAPSPAPASGYRGPGVYIGASGRPLMVGEPAEGWGWPVPDRQFVPYLLLRTDGSIDRALLALNTFVESGYARVATLNAADAEEIAETVRPGEDPDTALLAAAREALDADKAYDRRLAQCCGLSPTEAEEADLHIISDAWDDAGDRTLSIAPHTVRGVRAVLEVLATYRGFETGRTMTAIALLLASPVLAG